MPTLVDDSSTCLHANALPYRSDYLHYCIDCGRTVFVPTGKAGFETDENRGLYRGELAEPDQTSGDSETAS